MFYTYKVKKEKKNSVKIFVIEKISVFIFIYLLF